MQKKLLVASLLLLLGAGCSTTATVGTTTDASAASGTQETGTPEQNDTATDTDGTVDIAVDASPETGTRVTYDGKEAYDAVSFTVTGSNFAFSPSTMTVKKGDHVTVTFKNADGFHDWVIDEITGAKTSRIMGGAEETISFIADTAGSFTYYCSVGEHRAMGMVGTLVVTE